MNRVGSGINRLIKWAGVDLLVVMIASDGDANVGTVAFVCIPVCVFVLFSLFSPSGAVFSGVHVSLFDYFYLCLDVQVWVFLCVFFLLLFFHWFQLV